MNIFYALSEGRGKLTETNLSAFLSFLLSPNGSHGFGDIFLRTFLSEIEVACNHFGRFQNALDSRRISAQIDLEVRYENRTVDIDIQIIDQNESKIHHLIIENKINVNAANSDQLRDQFTCITSVLKEEELCPITLIFLTPPGDSKQLIAEYDALEIPFNSEHKKAWLHWRANSESRQETKTIVDMIRNLLQLEVLANIEPISDYSRHTLKAFVQFLENSIRSPSEKFKPIGTEEENDLIAEHEVYINGKCYRLCRFRSGVVTALDKNADQKVPAHPILRQVISLYELKIPLERGPGKPLNTRQLGQKVLDKLKQINS